jgi:hypothetical protein
VSDAARLLGERPAKAGMVVTEKIDPPGGYPVDIPFPFEIDEINTLSAVDGNGGEEFMILLLGAGMPDMFAVQP